MAVVVRVSRSRLLALLLIAGAAGCSAGPARQPAAVAPTPVQPPQVARQTIGTSVEGRPIEMIRIGAGEPAILLIAGIHGDEQTGVFIAERLREKLTAADAPPMPYPVAIIPCANPDGRAADHRTNAHGVDINRNFPASNWRLTRAAATFGGPKPASEPETAALIEAINSLHPQLIISIHSIRNGKHCNNYDGPAREAAVLMTRYNGYPVSGDIGYPTPGSLGSWAGGDRHMALITLELPREQPGENAWADNREALLAVLRSPSPRPASVPSSEPAPPGTAR